MNDGRALGDKQMLTDEFELTHKEGLIVFIKKC